MSLDFYLLGEEITEPCICVCCENIHERKCRPRVFHRNITHNLCEMAQEAGIYKCLWRPDENGFIQAKDIIAILEKSLDNLVRNPSKFTIFNPDNGWGSFERLVTFVSDVLEACKKYPNAKIETCR